LVCVVDDNCYDFLLLPPNDYSND